MTNKTPEYYKLKMLVNLPGTIKELAERAGIEENEALRLLYGDNRFLPSTDIKGIWTLSERGKDYITTHDIKMQKDRVVGKPKELQVSFKNNDNTLYEQVFHDGKEMFAKYDARTDSIDYVDSFVEDDLLYKPIPRNPDERTAVMLPTEPEDYGDANKLLDDIQNHIHKWLDVTPEYENIIKYVILFFWLYDRFYNVPYLRVIGDFSTGKSRFLDTVGGICYKRIMVAGAITPAPMYRMVEKWKGTLVIDEADMKDSGYQAEIVKILDCGFERNRPIMRMKDGKDGWEIETFDAFCPKIIATRGTFRDKALESRCLTEVMQETERNDIKDNLNEEFFEEQLRLRNKLLMFRFKNYFKINPRAAENINLSVIERRLRQISRPIIATLIKDQQALTKFLKYLEKYNKDLIQNRADSWEGMIVNSLINVYDNSEIDNESVSAKTIVNQMKEDYSFKPDKEPSAQGIGKRLKTFGIETKKKRIGEKTIRVLQLNEQIIDKLKRKYDVSSVSSVSSVPEGLSKYVGSSIIKNHDLPNIHDTHGNTSPHTGFENEKTSKPMASQNDTNNSTKVQFLLNMLKTPQTYQYLIDQWKSKYGENSEIEFEEIADKLLREGVLFEPTVGKLRKT